METGKIKTLYSDMERTEALFPRTKISAVSDDGGRGLDALLENLPYFSSVDSSEAATVPIDADTLGGVPASNYATQSFVTNKIAEAQLNGESGEIDLSGFATKDDFNTVSNLIGNEKVSKQITTAINNINYPVDSVNNKTGKVVLTAKDIGAANFEHEHIKFTSSSYINDNIPDLPNNLAQMTAQDFYELYRNLKDSNNAMYLTEKSYTCNPLIEKDGEFVASTEQETFYYYTYECIQNQKTNIVNNISTGETFYENIKSKNTIIIFCGLHGTEKQSIWSLYHIIRNIFTEESGLNTYIKNNYNFVIAPCVNQYGINNNTRENQNNVDLNRNFDNNFANTDVSEKKGICAFSETGTQFCREILLQHNSVAGHNGCIILDLHDFTGGTDSTKSRNFYGSSKDPQIKHQLLKLFSCIYDDLNKNHPLLIKGDNPIYFINGSNSPMLIQYAYKKLKFKHCLLHETRVNYDKTRFCEISNEYAYKLIRGLVKDIATSICGIIPSNYYASEDFDMASIRLIELIEELKTIKKPFFMTRILSSDKIIEDMPDSKTGMLQIVMDKRITELDNEQYGGIATFIDNKGNQYHGAIINSGFVGWV